MEIAKTCSEKTKQKMALALKELMTTTSFEKITVSDITEACGIHRQTFYYHFQDRYELLDWLIYSELIVPFIGDFNFVNMYDKCYSLFSTMYKDKKFYLNAYKVGDRELNKYMSAIATDDFAELVKRLSKKENLEPTDIANDRAIAEFIGFGISGIISNWVANGMKESPKEMTERIKHISISMKTLMLKG